MEIENLHVSQQEITEAIKKFITNLHKTALERRTGDYFKRRLGLLENYWTEYQTNHKSISGLNIREHPYFSNSEYERTKELYNTAKEVIFNQSKEQGTIPTPSTVGKGVSEQRDEQREMQQDKAERSAENETGSSQQMVSRGLMSKQDELFRKQMINFKAFMRTTNNIQIDSMNEKWEFEDVLKELQSRWTAIDALHWDIYMESNGEDEEYERLFTRHETIFINLKKAVNKKLWSVSHREKSVPKMEIPIFSGNYQQWTSFKDLFNEAVHNNPSLSLAQKMQFLKGKLRGEAERLVQHLHISSDNYSACWEILTNRYNNKKHIFTAHLNTLLGLPNLSQPSLVQIKRMHDVTLETLHAIENLEVDVSTWDPFLVHILSQKLDSDTYSDYSESLKNPRDLPILKEFLSFLEAKFTSLETARRKQDQVSTKPSASSNQPKSNEFGKKPYNYSYNYNNYNKNTNKTFHTSTIKCPLCNQDHALFHCRNFNSLSGELKLKKARELKLCLNCLFDHNGKQCVSTKRCRKCDGKHNTLIHDALIKVKSPHNNSNEPVAKSAEHVANNVHVSPGGSAEVLLATALLKVIAEDGQCHILRALIDQGSQISLITENAAQRLGLKRTFCKGVVYGIGEKANNSKGIISITCRSMYTDFFFSTNVVIMRNLIKNLPNATFKKPSWQFVQNIDLADPEFYLSRPVDLLLGSDIYALIKMGGISRGEDPSQPLAEQTQLGWILFGKMQSYQCNVVLNDIENIQRFWEVEDIEVQSDVSTEDQACVDFYRLTTKRRDDGRYVVKLPMKQDVQEKLGSSKGIAVAQFRNLERKFENQVSLAGLYKAFINEYLDLNHMILSNNIRNYHNNETKLSCFLPHHAVQRAESVTTKLRVVFNASAKTSSGYSLNDVMFKGPNLQKDLQSLIIKWRQYRYAFTSDIEKMFRQIWVSEDDQQYQQIVWREAADQQIQSYQLTTVTYGTKAAPFLAMMTLKKLAADERSEYPEAAQVLEEAMYMDDLIHGSHDLEKGKKLIAEINHVLRSGGFTLRKWMSNEPELLKSIESKEHEQKPIFNFKVEGLSKTLGLQWDSEKDKFTFQYSISNSDKPSSLTKRTILSEISKLFDPLGWLAPLSTKLKILFQKVWAANLEWDDLIPEDIHNEWMKIKSDICNLKQCEIPRWIGYKPGDVIELHGFCDASLKAYAGVIYARIISNGQVTVVLLASKTRLVPHNKAISLPRLEVCGAHLLSNLMEKVITCINKQSIDVYGWTDSMVVLGWLQGDPGRWKTFVANRVRSITKIVPPNCWRYVKSGENPADAASRGLLASQLANSTLWWQGPEWLKTITSDNSTEKQVKYTTEEECKQKQVNTIQKNSEESIILQLLKSHACFIKITRILAYILRAINRIRFNKQKECKQYHGYLTLSELKRAKLLVIKYVQRCEFADDIEAIRKHKAISSRSKLLKLNPFLDTEGILRVGGRLKNADIAISMKFPMLLPHDGILTKLLVEHAHQLTFHGGPRLTLSNLRQRYWIISGNRAVKKEVRKCVKCRKHDPRMQYQLMANLPPERVNPAPPFYHTGVDYTGYVEIKANKGRGVKTTKGYVALFICMVTKAIHLELVSDLSSIAFIAALRRMAARRGAPRYMYSDNGTNFVGANRMLQEEFFDLKNTLDETFLNEIADLNIEWHFNAPSWASAGGLWERAVRSLKHHLKRVVGEQRLTFEEFSTLLAQLEACLNSRPLYPMSEDVEDLDVLTPAHFLTGRAGTTVIETEQDARTRWSLAHKLTQDIWKRFKSEYLTQLSIRSKWLKQQPNIKVGDLVTIQDENLPPGKWMLGRVIELHPGQDGLVRVVSLKTKNGMLKRPIVKLSVLPIESGSEDVSRERVEKNEGQRNESKRNKVKRSKIASGFISLAMYFVLFMTLVSGSCASYNITTINEYQGLYFDKIGSMRLTRDQWKLVVYYNMDPYWEGMTALDKYQRYLETICTSIRTVSHCDIIMLQLRHSYSELEFTNRALLGQQNSTRARKRRGLINGIGYVANALFGVLDEQFAEQYQKDITHIREDQKHLAKLWRNQTSIVEGEYNVLQRIRDTINKQHKVVNLRLNELSKATNTLKEEIRSVEVMNEFTLSAMIANNLIVSLRNIQDQLVDMLVDVHHQIFNTHILSPQQLLDQLNVISGQLTKDLSLPIENIHQELVKIYQLLQVKARLTNHYFIFEIRIPLITRDNYELHKIIPIPLKRANDMVAITPVSDYIAVNLQKDTYLPLSGSEIQQCVNSGSFNCLCNMHTAIYHMRNEHSLCVYDPDTQKCQTSTVACNNQWIQLSKLNSFLSFCCKPCELRFMCGDQVTVEQLTGTCIINLAPDCIVKDKHFTAYAHNIQLSKTIRVDSNVYSPQIAPINHIINISLDVYENETTDLEISLELQKLGESIKQMKNTVLPDDSDFYHHIHHYAISYGLVLAAVLAAAVYLWRRRRRARPRAVEVRELPASPTPTSSISVFSQQCFSQPIEETVVSVYTTNPTTMGTNAPLGVYHQIANNIAEKITSPIYKFLGINSTKSEPNAKSWNNIELQDDPIENKHDVKPIDNDISKDRDVEEISVAGLRGQNEKKPEKITLYSSYLPVLAKASEGSSSTDQFETKNDSLSSSTDQVETKNDTWNELGDPFNWDSDEDVAKPREGAFVYILELFGSIFQFLIGGFVALFRPNTGVESS